MFAETEHAGEMPPGLGLLSCDIAIGMQCGTITVEREIGKGSTLIVELPA